MRSSLRLLGILALALPLLGNDDCAPDDQTSGDGSPDVDFPADVGGGAALTGMAGECAPVAMLSCGTTVLGDSLNPNDGTTDVIDGYPVSIGNYGGPEIAWAFQAQLSEDVTFELVDPRPTVINHDLFVLEYGDGTCQSANAIERGFNAVTFPAEAGRTYFLVLDSFADDGGAFEAHLDCTGPGGTIDPQPGNDVTTEVFFSPTDVPDSHLQATVDAIDAATTSLDVAMYSFSYGPLMDALQAAQDRGVSIRVITNDAAKHRKRPEGTRSAALEDMGIEVRWINKIQHHKYVLIDGPRTDLAAASTATLITGSGNWSWSAATKYDENTVLIQGDAALTLEFQKEFNHLWDNSRDVVWNEDIAAIGHAAISESSIDAASGDAEAVMTSDNFTTYESATYGPTFKLDADLGVARDSIAHLIENAQSSVWIASGHLRSRQITDAILKAWDDNPTLDLRVYLDGQEYVGDWKHSQEVDGFEECMTEAAGHPADQRDCRDKGLHFGWDLAAAGVDLRYKHYSYRWHYATAKQLHHKYVIVDGQTVASGSYNYSNNAEHQTMENVVVYDAADYPELVSAFVGNFDSIWGTGRTGYGALMNTIENTADDVPLVYDAMALSHDELGALKTAIRAACPQVDDEEWRANAATLTSCPR